MAKSGSFVGSTSPSQSKFLPVVYWSTNLADTDGNGVYDSWKVDVYVNYKCYDLYLGSIGSQNITISVDGGGSKNPASKAISDNNGSMHEGRWIDTQTFYIPFSGRETWTSATINFKMTYVRGLVYSNVKINSCSASGTAQLETAYTSCSAPTSISISNTSPKKGQQITISWSGAKGGTENSITGYDIEYKVGSGGWNSWRSVSTGNTYSSTTDSWSQPVGQTGQYRVRTKGSAGSNYYSGWAYSGTLTISNSAPVMNSVSRNTSLVAYNNGNGGSASFSWSASDVDNDSLRYMYKLSNSSSWSSYTTETSKSITVKGSQGSLISLSVIANDYKVDSGSKTSSSVRINTIPTTPTIRFTNSSGTTITPNAKPASLYYALSSTVAYSGNLSFEVYLEIGNSSSMTSISSRYYMGIYSGSVYLDLQDNSGPSRYIGENQYYRIRVRAYDGYDYSDYAYSESRQKNSAPNYDSLLTNTYRDSGITKLDNVYWKLSDGRLRKGNIIDNEAVLSWTMPDTSGRSSLAKVILYRNMSNDSTMNTWINIWEESISSIEFTITTTKITKDLDGNIIDTVITTNKTTGIPSDINIGTTVNGNITTIITADSIHIDTDFKSLSGTRANYKLIFEDEYGWTQEDSNAKILTLFKNNNPVFAGGNSLKTLRVSSTGAPTIKIYNNESIDISWIKTSGDSDDDAILLTPTGETAPSYMSTPNKFKISLVFEEDPFISLEGGFPKDTSGNDIKEIVLVAAAKATEDDATYNRQTLSFSPELFSNFNNTSKRQQYSKVTIQVEAEDTFGKKSIDKLSTPIILDFRQKPIFDTDSSLYSIKDLTNNQTIIKLGEAVPSDSTPAYTSDGFYMINSGEQLQFKFPKAVSPNAPESGEDGIYSYLIYYATSTSTVTNENFRLLKEIPKSNLIPDGNYYIYNHTVSNYSVNNFVKFAVSAKDSGYGKTETEKRETALESEQVPFSYTMMVCRATNPSISLNSLDFDTAATEENARVKVNFTISDIGGSKSPNGNGEDISSYWTYRNFERFSTGKFFELSLLLSETEDFTSPTSYILDVQSENSSAYPPEPGQKSDDEKNFAYPWSNYEIETSSSQLVETKKSYYAKLILKVGHNINSTLDLENSYLYAETPVTFLRSLRATLSIRDKKIGINTKEPEYTLHVSAGSGSSNTEDQNTDNYVQFDSGIEGDQVIRFDLLTGHMVLGIIDCGRIL